jgi:hypothetical protein
MMPSWREFDAWFMQPVPPERLALLRIGVGGYALIYLLTRVQDLLAPLRYADSAFAPLGVVSTLAAPLPHGLVVAAYAASLVSGALFVAGVRYRVVAPLFASSLLWVLTYRHSWGMIFHTDNLLALHVVLLCFAPAAQCYRLGVGGAASQAAVSGWVLRVSCLVTVAAYVVAGMAKLQLSGFTWAAGGALREQIAYDALRKIELGSLHSPLGPWLLPHGWLFAPLSVFSLGAELLAPLALFGGRWAIAWCLSAWIFHLGVLATMAIAFPYPLSGVAFLAFFPIERWFEAARRRWRARKYPSPQRSEGTRVPG